MPWKFNEQEYDICVNELKRNDPSSAYLDYTKDKYTKIYQRNIIKLNKMLDELKQRLEEKTEKYTKNHELDKKNRPQKLREITDWIDRVEILLKRFNEAHQFVTMPKKIIEVKTPKSTISSTISTPAENHFMREPIMSVTPISKELSVNPNFSLVEAPDTKKLVLQEKQEKTKCCCCF
jgi:hypothetical protein